MATLEIKRQLTEADIAAVAALLDVAERADGHPPLDEHRWLHMARGGREAFAGLVAWEAGHGHPIGYAQLSRRPESWALDLVIDPHHRYDVHAIAPAMLRAALDLVAEEGGGEVHFWVNHPTTAHDAVAAEVGLAPARELLQLRRALPVGDSPVDDSTVQLDTRPFRPGHDETAWLAVNNRAFSWHPEQGGWDLATLEAREAEAWFDADGFLLHERDGRLAGFCWTKVHAHRDPPVGEIFVVAVDPDFQGLGLGAGLVRAGLDWLGAHDLTVAMLYVDADNASAVRLYERLGFTVDHVDRVYMATVAAAQVTPVPTNEPTA